MALQARLTAGLARTGAAMKTGGGWLWKRENFHIQFVLLIFLISICITGPIGHMKLYNEGNSYFEGFLHGMTYLCPFGGGYDHIYPTTDVSFSFEIITKILIFLFVVMCIWRFTFVSYDFTDEKRVLKGNIGYLSIVVLAYVACNIGFGIMRQKETNESPRNAANNAMDTALFRSFDPSTTYGKAQFYTNIALLFIGIYLFVNRDTRSLTQNATNLQGKIGDLKQAGKNRYREFKQRRQAKQTQSAINTLVKSGLTKEEIKAALESSKPQTGI